MLRHGFLWKAIVIVAIFILAINTSQGQLSSTEKLYREADAQLDSLLKSSTKINIKSEWDRCIASFREIVVLYPEHAIADDALFKLVELYLGAYNQFKNKEYQDKALISLKTIVEKYPQSKYQQDALFTLAEIYFSEFRNWKTSEKYFLLFLQRFPKTSRSEFVKQRLNYVQQQLARKDGESSSNGKLAKVKNIRHWSGKAYTRVVIDLDKEVRYKYQTLSKPSRIYFDLLDSKLESSLKNKSFPVKDEFLQKVRVAQNKKDVVRVVLDFATISDYSVFSLYNPDRVVIDILGRGEGREIKPEHIENKDKTDTIAEDKQPSLPKPNKEGKYTLARQLGLQVGTVVIDPGHGGGDPGAIGYNGLQEKMVTLDIAQRLKKILEDQLECNAILTRSDDTYMTLEERTAIANTNSADLFLSIHTNANPSKSTRGVETYFLNFAISPEAAALAARENAISHKNMAKLQDLVKKITLNTKIDESKELAHNIQNNMYSYLKRWGIVNLGVKQAPFYVLIGANMPSILVEVSFITHPVEESLLEKESYRQHIAEALYEGIKSYMSSLS
jgi:N-acetylmuramoyl-L-alanine amidase